MQFQAIMQIKANVLETFTIHPLNKGHMQRRSVFTLSIDWVMFTGLTVILSVYQVYKMNVIKSFFFNLF